MNDGDYLDGVDEDTKRVMADMLGQELIANTPPAKLKMQVKALKTLKLDGLDKDEALTTLLEFFTAMLGATDHSKETLAELAAIWSLHYHKALPNYAYEE